MVEEKPPSLPYIENIPYVNFNEGSLALMWDKRKGNTKYDKKSEILWLVPYIVNNEVRERYLLFIFHGWKKDAIAS
jgi:hypothetical protein